MPEISKKRIGDLPFGHDRLMERTNETIGRERRGRGFPSREGAGEEFPEKQWERQKADVPDVFPEEMPAEHPHETHEYQPFCGNDIFEMTGLGTVNMPYRAQTRPGFGDDGLAPGALAEGIGTLPPSDL
ncbi:MAG: hypothetical protein K6G56_01360 [Clostridiales bacterium]|nr:hypothetical protein [Clostridiales bacterium]